MTKRILVTMSLLFLTCTAATVDAQQASTNPIGATKKFGLGVGGGSFTYGLAPKLYLTPNDAVQGSVGWTVYGLQVGADYLRQLGTALDHPAGRLWYGAGAGVEVLMYNYLSRNASEVGVAGVGEVGWHFSSMPLEVTASIRPTFYFGEFYAGLYFAGGGAIRWYF
jgi:hypothetical protein